MAFLMSWIIGSPRRADGVDAAAGEAIRSLHTAAMRLTRNRHAAEELVERAHRVFGSWRRGRGESRAMRLKLLDALYSEHRWSCGSPVREADVSRARTPQGLQAFVFPSARSGTTAIFLRFRCKETRSGITHPHRNGQSGLPERGESK